MARVPLVARSPEAATFAFATQTRDPIRALIKIKSAIPVPDAGFVVSPR
jgi:hypothetical protein